MRKNDEATVGITDMNSLGYGVGHVDGKAVFVPDAAPGDLLRVLIIKDAGRYFVGKRLEILRASDLRIASACPSFPRCGGCAFRHISYEAEKRVKEDLVRGFFKKEGLAVEILPILSAYGGSGYRNKIQYPVREGKLGYFAPHSHRVIENAGCALHRPEAERVIAALRVFLNDRPVPSYDETTGRGLLRHICLRTDRRGENMLLTLAVNGRSYPYTKELAAFLQSECPAVRGLYLNINQKNTNVIFGDEFKLLWGQPTITDELLSCSFEIGPASFYQVYPEGCEILYREVIARADLKGGEKIVDLFCGVGTIGVCLMKSAPSGCALTGIEIVPEAVDNARRNAERNGIENARFVCGDANHPALRDADVVIVDPPRKGLEEALVSHLSSLEALQKIVYVSCGPDTLARDLARFAARGWEIGPAQPVDMFPRTGHVESVVLMSRAGL